MGSQDNYLSLETKKCDLGLSLEPCGLGLGGLNTLVLVKGSS